MSTLEIAILIAAGVMLIVFNLIATIRVVRRVGRYGVHYVLFIWFVPVLGALFILATLKRARPARLLPANPNTISSPSTIQADPWPTVGDMTGSHPPYRK